MKHLTFILLALLAAAALLPSCKTSEANYRAAYERAIATRDSAMAFDSTIYGSGRRPLGVQTVISGADTFDLRVIRVAVTEDGGETRENLHPFNVVVGQFKQVFNAKSMRERLAAAGYESAFVVQTAEPYYYVVLSSWKSRDEAIAAMRAIPADFPIALRESLPFILANPMK